MWAAVHPTAEVELLHQWISLQTPQTNKSETTA